MTVTAFDAAVAFDAAIPFDGMVTIAAPLVEDYLNLLHTYHDDLDMYHRYSDALDFVED